MDAYPTQEDAGVLEGTTVDGDNANFASLGTVDALCLGNGYLPSDGTQNAYITWRFMLGPFGSIHEWSALYRTGPDHGIGSLSLASIPENDSASGFADDTGILQDISTLSFVALPGTIDAYSAALARNAHSFAPTHPLRVMGQPGDTLTAVTFDAGEGIYHGDGGPGPYALKLTIATKAVASTGFKFDLQALHRKRLDWAFG